MIGENQPNKYRATCCGIRKDPPTLYVRYKVISTGTDVASREYEDKSCSLVAGVIRSRRIYLKGVDAKRCAPLDELVIACDVMGRAARAC
jgi:hypothetical protein